MIVFVFKKLTISTILKIPSSFFRGLVSNLISLPLTSKMDKYRSSSLGASTFWSEVTPLWFTTECTGTVVVGEVHNSLGIWLYLVPSDNRLWDLLWDGMTVTRSSSDSMEFISWSLISDLKWKNHQHSSRKG